MSILIHEHQKQPVEHFSGGVLRVHETDETRNCSDTLDYTDFQTIRCKWALVLLPSRWLPPTRRNGRVVTHYYVSDYDAPRVRDLTPAERVAWLDCTSFFTWRGSPLMVPTEDADLADPEIIACVEAFEAQEKAHFEAVRAAAEAAKRAAEEAEMKRPDKGRECVVVKGRKVPKGTRGMCFWVGPNKFGPGTRLGLKLDDDSVVWVDAAHCEALPPPAPFETEMPEQLF